MSFLRYMLTTDYARFHDLETVEVQASETAANARGTDGRVQQLATTVGQLAATVRVLTRTLAEAGLLDTSKIEAAIEDELEHPTVKAERVHCRRCNAEHMSTDMVRVGADTWCRDCARNP